MSKNSQGPDSRETFFHTAVTISKDFRVCSKVSGGPHLVSGLPTDSPCSTASDHDTACAMLSAVEEAKYQMTGVGGKKAGAWLYAADQTMHEDNHTSSGNVPVTSPPQ